MFDSQDAYGDTVHIALIVSFKSRLSSRLHVHDVRHSCVQCVTVGSFLVNVRTPYRAYYKSQCYNENDSRARARGGWRLAVARPRRPPRAGPVAVRLYTRRARDIPIGNPLHVHAHTVVTCISPLS